MTGVRTLLVLAASALGAGQLAGQDVAARLAGRVPPDVARAVVAIATDAMGRGLPVDQLVQKALEGGAKGVPAERVIAAVRALASRLGEAREALRGGGLTAPAGEVVEAGADALNAGLMPPQVAELARVSRAPFNPAVTLRVTATLAALGVPPDKATRLVETVIRSGGSPDDVLALPGAVQADVARGATPGEAAERAGHHQQGGDEGSGAGHGGQGQGAGGGHHGPPPPPPPEPKHKPPHTPTSHKP